MLPYAAFHLGLHCLPRYMCSSTKNKLEDLKVLRRSPDLLNNVKIGQDQLKLIIKHICFTIYGGCSHFGDISSPNEWHWIKGHRSA